MFSSCSEAVWKGLRRSCLFTVSHSLVSLPTISADIKTVWEHPILSEWDTFAFRVALINKFPSVVFRSDCELFWVDPNSPVPFLGSLGISGWCCQIDMFITGSRCPVSLLLLPVLCLAFPREEWLYGSSSKSFVLSTECRIQLHFPSPLCRGNSITSATEISDYMCCCSYMMLHLGKPVIATWKNI